MLNPRLVEDVEAAVRSAVAPIVVDEVRIVEGQNFDADNVLIISIDLPAGTGPLPAPNYMEMLRSVGHTLLQAGEERPALFRTLRSDDEEALENPPTSHP